MEFHTIQHNNILNDYKYYIVNNLMYDNDNNKGLNHLHLRIRINKFENIIIFKNIKYYN